MTTLDLAAAAAFLGVHRETLRERAAAGIIPGAARPVVRVTIRGQRAARGSGAAQEGGLIGHTLGHTGFHVKRQAVVL